MKKFYFFIVLYFAGLDNSLVAQNFTNPDLTGTNVNTLASLPTGWSNIPATDVVCLTPTTHLGIGDTPDLTTINGPTLTLGIAGNAYSGNSFVSGVRGDNFHEGMMQTLNGFTPGKMYKIEFYQSVVKQENCRDTSGAWSIFLDHTLIQHSQLSVSHLSYNNPNLIWDHRTVLFMATSTTHTLKFLPYDDDTFGSTQTQQEDAALRMGIDLITLEEFIIPSTIIDTTICDQNNFDVQLSESGASFNWTDGFVGPNRSISQEGSYEVAISSNDTLYTIVYRVDFFNEHLAQLPPDTLLCERDTLVIPSPQNTYDFSWQDGSSTNQFVVFDSTTLYYTIAKDQCTFTDSMKIEMFKFDINLFRDTLLCQGDTLYLNFNNNYSYSLNSTLVSSSSNLHTPGIYEFEISNTLCSLTDTFRISYIPPLVVSYTADTSFCSNQSISLSPLVNQSELKFLWSTGSENPMIITKKPGIYTVTISNPCQSENLSINLSLNICDAYIFVPNSFSPNSDSFNDYFQLISQQEFALFEWRIFDRWDKLYMKVTPN